MNDERLGKALGAFYKGIEEVPPDPRLSADRIMAQVPTVRQVRRRRWLPSLRRNEGIEPATRSAEYRAAQVPPTNGRTHHAHTPTVTGRTQSMLSPAKAITAGALVFAVGGVLLIAQPFQLQSSVPGAAIDPTLMAPAPAVEGSFTIWERDGSRGEREPIEDLGSIEHAVFDITFESSDPRLSGSGTLKGTDWFSPPTGSSSATTADLGFGTIELANDEGRWTGTFVGIDEITPFSLTGEEGYEGLIASVVMDFGSTSERGFALTGAIAPTFMLAEPPTVGDAGQ